MAHTFTYTDIGSNDQYDVIPDSVRLTVNDETIKAIRDAKEALVALISFFQRLKSATTFSTGTPTTIMKARRAMHQSRL
jgi:hypothetical protein